MVFVSLQGYIGVLDSQIRMIVCYKLVILEWKEVYRYISQIIPGILHETVANNQVML